MILTTDGTYCPDMIITSEGTHCSDSYFEDTY